MTASIRMSNDGAYYLAVDHALYYLTGELGVGVWHGAGASALGFRGPVLPEALLAAYEGYSADGLRQLVQVQQGKKRQAAWDITFSCPKCLSVLWSVLAPDDRHRIETIVMQAAQRAVDYLDQEALFTRRGKFGTRIEKAHGVFALCPHGTSRALDPQLSGS